MIYTADKLGRTDSAYHTLVSKVECKYPVVIVSWVDGFIFNDALLDVTEAILFDYGEYGWDVEITDTPIWGNHIDQITRYESTEWYKFNNWAKTNVKLQFKRELLKKDVSDTIVPLEYPCLINPIEIQPKEQFDVRPVNVFNFWGRSNENRIRIQGEIWLHSYMKGFQVCDNLFYTAQYLVEEKGEKWVSLWIPHWARVDIGNLMAINSVSKLCLSFKGSGEKCFRSAEAPTCSIMVMHRKDYAWSFPWDETNCILVEVGKEIEGIEGALKRNDLYDIYLKGVENADHYRVDKYINEYILPKINSL